MNLFSSLMKPKNKYSLENLKYLYNTLLKNTTITQQNTSIVVETLRSIAEVLIWGDQNNNTLFDFFLEKNLLGFFVNILGQKTSSDVTIQLLQTLSILVENLRTKNSIYFLLSNNFINEIIIHKYDFSNEEVLDYYISFLKALSLKLDQSTINFFFNGYEKDFPLYTEAIKFINHKETMIRIAVRTLTLNVFKVEDDEMRSYIINSTAVPYFSNIVWFIRQQCATLNKVLERSNHDNLSQLNYYVEELTDQFYYLHDIFNLGFDSMNFVLAEQFVQYLIFPLLIGSLLDVSRNPELEDRLSPTLALFLLAQVFHIFTFKPLLDTVASAIVSTSPSASLIVSTTTTVTAPPPLSLLGTQRAHYNSFRRFSSFQNLEQLENGSAGGGSGTNTPQGSPKKSKRRSILSRGNKDSPTSTPSTPTTPAPIQTSSPTTTSPTTTVTTNNISSQPTTVPSTTIITNPPNGGNDNGVGGSSGGSSSTTISQHTPVDQPQLSIPTIKHSGDEDEDVISNMSSPPSSPRHLSTSTSNITTTTATNNNNNNNNNNKGLQLKLKSDLSSSVDSGSTNMSDDTSRRGSNKSSTLQQHLQKARNEYKEILIQLIHKDRETFGVVCMFYSLLKNPYVDQKILEGGGVLPYRLAKAKKLLEGLLSPEARSPIMSSSLPSNLNSSHHRSRSESYTLFTNRSKKEPLFNELDIEHSTNNNNNSSNKGGGVSTSLKSNDGNNVEMGPILKIFRPKTPQEQREEEERLKEEEKQRHKRAIEKEEEEKEFIPVPDSYQKEYTRDLIERLFFVLMNSNQFRLVTLQMTLLILKELVYSSESPSKLTETQLAMLEEAYTLVANNLTECMSGNMAPVFLELFEEELRSYRQIIFESLVKDVALILPLPDAPKSRHMSLARRLPSGEMEKTQKAIQQFLVLRELKFTLLRRKDTSLPLKQPHFVNVRERDLFNLDTDMVDIIYYLRKPTQTGAGSGASSSSVGTSGTPTGPNQSTAGRVRNAGVLYHNLLLTIDQNNVPQQSKPGNYGVITHIAPLQRLEIEVSHLDDKVLRVFSHPTTWGVDMIFEEEKQCQSAKLLLERARDDIRSSKMRQIYTLLGERDPDDDDNPDTLLKNALMHSSTTDEDTGSVGSNGKASRVFVPVDASNSHPLAFSSELVSSRKLSGSRSSTSKATSGSASAPRTSVLERLMGAIDINEYSGTGTHSASSSPSSSSNHKQQQSRYAKENTFLSFLNDTDDTFLKDEVKSTIDNDDDSLGLKNVNTSLLIKKQQQQIEPNNVDTTIIQPTTIENDKVNDVQVELQQQQQNEIKKQEQQELVMELKNDDKVENDVIQVEQQQQQDIDTNNVNNNNNNSDNENSSSYDSVEF